MDRNTIVGFVLIFAVVLGFFYFTKPTEAEIAAEKRYNDSIAAVQKAQVKEEVAKANEAMSGEKKESSVDGFFDAAPKTQNAAGDSLATAATDSVSAPAPQLAEQKKEETFLLENDKMKVSLSTKGGQIVNVELKEYTDHKDAPLSVFGKNSSMSLLLDNKMGKSLDTEDAMFMPIPGKDGKTMTMRLVYTNEQYIDFIYAIMPDSYMIKFNIVAVGMKDILSRESQASFPITWKQGLMRKEKSVKNEQRYSHIVYKLDGQDVEKFGENKTQKEEVGSPVRWVAFKDQFFATAIIGDNAFETSVLNSRYHENAPNDRLKDFEATLYSPVNFENNGVLSTGYRIFAGPLEYYLLKGFDDGAKTSEEQLDLDKMIPLGWWLFRIVNQYFVIPLFSLLNSSGLALGLVILLLTLIVKLIISPLTYKSFMSSAKMRVLRPQIEEINAKYPKQEQAMDRQKATMSLYNKAGVSPMAGCMPMILQMPVLLALFSFFPSAIELRHESFLWATDLSSYDAIIEWSGNIPLVSWALGNHLSLFCVLMTVTTIIYTKFNMDATNTGQQQMPGMKWMMYLMPVVFLFVLNDYPSGLTYYYFLSTLITIVLTLIFRFSINEEKVLAKLEANKLKPKKKSGFMARLEEAQRLQQQQAKSQNKNRNKNR
ncbi:YidC/Oxa1 family membrane protein insertase [Dysgonomonas sp. PH5-45]|uniref:membrane protein insertase YidC n=1 Tax=unclassified Dysgonomonas TaxID=2630389 RepID=UPI0024740598|nr:MULTISPECIES: membrane protein insertase YidC [unclassified Dysgonomonas]MDH6354994.1 YidC/Oxa1 family membrane protein insertase [Dysgonomonas sp. PH5-45]MDH6387882.1 YidC/Oxa1 family membrane protein insertase [Dysgonomonas sp. PH5-37]